MIIKSAFGFSAINTKCEGHVLTRPDVKDVLMA